MTPTVLRIGPYHSFFYSGDRIEPPYIRIERDSWRLIGEGEGIHWPDLDEDISIEHLLIGVLSGESQRLLQKWLGSRAV